jgi:hypothetical protein
MRGFLVGAFALIVLQVLTQDVPPGAPDPAAAFGGAFSVVGAFVHGFMDPNTPAIPDHSKPTATTSSSTTTDASSSSAAPVGSPPGNTGSGALNVQGFVPGTI